MRVQLNRDDHADHSADTDDDADDAAGDDVAAVDDDADGEVLIIMIVPTLTTPTHIRPRNHRLRKTAPVSLDTCADYASFWARAQARTVRYQCCLVSGA